MTVIKQYNPGSSQWEPVLVGAGVPTGGTVGQVVAKASSVDYDTEWVDAGAGGIAGVTVFEVGGGAWGDINTFDFQTGFDLTESPTGEVNISLDLSEYAGAGLLPQAKVANLTTDLAAKALTTDLTTHAADTTAIHGIADTSVLETTTGAQAKVDLHVNDTTAAHAATAISYAGSTNLVATTVEAALDELDAEKQPLDADLTTIAGLTATTGNMILSAGSAWTSATPATVKTALAIASTDVSGLGSLATKSTIGTADITDGVVSNTDLTTMAANTVKMNNTGATAAPQDVTVAALLTALGLSVPVTVAQGGSGRNTATTAYGLLAAGTTATGIQQTVTPAASGFLKTTSATALPAWTAIAQADVTNLVNDLSNKQPLDSDLSAIAILAHATNSMIQSNGSAWIAATPTQVKTGLAITKTDVGLANVDNTSDANKAISTATQTALDNKQALDTDLTIIAGLVHAVGSVIQSNGASWAASTPAQVKTSLTLVKGDVGLANVDNTSDVNKPVSTAQATADGLKADKTTTISVTAPITGGGDLSANRTIGVNTFGTAQAGVVPQSGGGTANYLRADGSWTPPPGSGGITDGDKGEVTVTAGVWSIDADVVTNAKLANMAANSFKGNNTGSVADPLDMSVTEAKALLGMTKTDVGLSNVDNTSDANKPVSTAQATAIGLKADKTITITGTGSLNGGGALDANRTLDVATAGITLAKMANLAQDQVIGRVTASTGVPETFTITAAARTVLDDTTVGAMLTTLGAQPADTDLTTLAGLTATTGNMILSAGSAWTSATPATVKTALALDQVNNTSDANKPVSTAQATADSLRVLKTGDTMTGILYLQDPATAELRFRDASTTRAYMYCSTVPGHLVARTQVSGATISLGPGTGADKFSLSATDLTMSVPVTLPADPASALQAATKQYVDGLAAQATLDSRYVNAAGDIMTGPLNLHGTTIVVKDAPGTTTRGTISGSAQGVSIDDLEVTSDFVCQGYADFNSGLGTSETISISSDDLMFTLSGGVEYGVYWYNGGLPQGRVVHNATRMDLKGDKPGGLMGVTVRNAANTLDFGLTLSETTVTAGVPITLPGAPTSSLHAATKQYVDDNAGGGGGTTTWTGTQAAFDALVTLDVDTFYYVVP